MHALPTCLQSCSHHCTWILDVCGSGKQAWWACTFFMFHGKSTCKPWVMNMVNGCHGVGFIWYQEPTISVRPRSMILLHVPPPPPRPVVHQTFWRVAGRCSVTSWIKLDSYYFNHEDREKIILITQLRKIE